MWVGDPVKVVSGVVCGVYVVSGVSCVVCGIALQSEPPLFILY